VSAPAAQIDIDHILAHTVGVWEALRGARIFITGGTGFVGTWLMEALVAANAAYDLDARVTLLTRNPAGFRARSPHLAQATGVKLVAGNLADFAFPSGSFSHAIHAATERSYPADSEHPLGILADDAIATHRVLDFCRAAGVRRLLFTSSGAVYGTPPKDRTWLIESDASAPDTMDVHSVYGQSKRQSEFACALYAKTMGFEVTVARLFAFVGPHLPLNEGYAIGNFLRDAMAGGPIRIAGDGTPLRSYLYAADLAIWLWHIAVRGTPGRAYNVGSPHAVSIHDLARTVVSATMGEAAIEVAQRPVPGSLPARYVPSTERARTELSLQPWIALPEAVRRTFDWHRSMNSVANAAAQ
jgi:nucleoside-diphosphate-sugar epimerase